MTTFPINPLPAGVTSKPTVTFLNQGSTSTNYLTYTFTGRSLGVASANRYIVLSAHSSITPSWLPVSATIAGVSANTLFSDQGLGLFIAKVPTGTTGDVTITFSATADRCFFGMWSLTGPWSGGSALIKSASGTTAGSGSPASVLTKYANGGVIISAATFGTSNGTTATWSGVMTGDYLNYNGSAARGFGAHTASNLSGPSEQTISVYDNGASSAYRIVSAAFR